MRVAVLALALVVVGSLVSAEAQSTGAVPKVGYLGLPNEPSEASPWRDAFLRGLRDLGHIPGQTLVVDVRRYSTEDQLRHALGEFVRLKMDVIFVGPPFAAMAAKQATREIPIVCGSCGDPVENGLAASLARPGGNVTGLASLSAELLGKRMGLLKELLPDLSRAAVFLFPANPGTPPTLRALEVAGRTLGVEIQQIEIRTAADFDNAFRSAARSGAGAIVLQDDPLTRSARTQIAQLALKHRLPVSTGVPEVADAGALIAYGPDRVDMFRRAAAFTDKILKGAKPADLPVEQPKQFEFIINLKTAKQIGLTIPPNVLVRADRVIR